MSSYSSRSSTQFSSQDLQEQARKCAAPEQPFRLRMHVEELVQIEEKKPAFSFTQKSQNSLLYAYLHYIVANTIVFVKSLIFAPVSILFDPLSTAAILVIYPVIYSFLFVAILGLSLLSSVGGTKIMDWLSLAYGGGYSIVNWPSPELINSKETRETIQSAFATFGGAQTVFPDVLAPGESPSEFSPPKTTRIFDLDVAKAMLAFSALVYERKDNLVEQSVAKAASGSLQEAEALLIKSEEIIRQQASKWGLDFEGISDLSSTSGPFASVFYSRGPKKFICVVFKGTTPSNFAEFLVDASINRISATSFFGDGTVHEGFATSLFPMYRQGHDTDGYGQILAQLKVIAKNLSSPDDDQAIPLWVTGHSLGSALAGLFYARLLRMPADLDTDENRRLMVVRDCYLFGTPRLGDGQFSAKFDESMTTPINRKNNLWRVKNAADIVTRIPPGNDLIGQRGILGTSTSILNYSHIGSQVYLTPKKEPFYTVDLGAYHHASRMICVQEGQAKPHVSARSVAYHSAPNPLRFVMCYFLPSFAFDHFPASYAQHLAQIKATGKGGEERITSKDAQIRGADPKVQASSDPNDGGDSDRPATS